MLRFIATGSCNSSHHQGRFSKMKLVKTFPQNSMTSERFGNIDLLSFETYELKNDLDDFDSRHDNRRIKLR